MVERLPRLDPETCYLFLVRHGATINNVADPPRLQGRRVDWELSPEGRAEAEAAGRFLARFPLAAVYASPLLRARQTAEAVCRPHKLQAEIVEGLTECDVGQWEEKSWPQIRQEDPQGYTRFHQDPSIYPYGGGENFNQVLARIEPVFAQLMQAHLGRMIAAVAHKVVNRVYLAHLLPWPLAKSRDVPQFNCGISLIRHRPGETQALSVNSVFHLDDWSQS